MCNLTLRAVTALPLCLCGRGHLWRQPWVASPFWGELPGVTDPSLKRPGMHCTHRWSNDLLGEQKKKQDEGQKDIQYDSTALSICMLMRGQEKKEHGG